MGDPRAGSPAGCRWSISALGRATTWVMIVVAVVLPLLVVVLAVAQAWEAWWVPLGLVAMGALWLRQTAWAATAVELTGDGDLVLTRPVGRVTVAVERVVRVRRSLWGGEGRGGGQVLIVTERASVPLSLGLSAAGEIAEAIQAGNPNVRIAL